MWMVLMVRYIGGQGWKTGKKARAAYWKSQAMNSYNLAINTEISGIS
jgi:hypothetical protein